MNRLLFPLLAVLLWSCNSHLDKSVLEPLTVDELKKSIKADPSFERLYRDIVYVRDTVLKSEVDKVKYADLTYARMSDFYEFTRDTAYFNPIEKEIRQEWQDKFGSVRQKVDSISDYWKDLRKENSLDKYVQIELNGLDKERYAYTDGIREMYLAFKLTPLKGKIEQIRFSYSIEPKINEGSTFRPDKSWCLSSKPFSKSVVRYWEVDYSTKKALEYKTTKTFKRDYNIYTEISEIRKDGKNISIDDLVKIPEVVKSHWKCEKGTGRFSKDLYVDDIAKEFITPDYLDKIDYTMKRVSEILQEKDQLAYDFKKLRVGIVFSRADLF